jgi:hypothetical protein
MATLHGILAELGIENPDMHPEREIHPASQWVVEQDFTPITGKSYELAYGHIPFGSESQKVIKRVRIDGPTPADWFDLDAQKPLDPGLHGYPVQAFRLIA